MMRITETVKHLIIINVIFFVASQFIGQPMYDKLALYYPETTHFHYWQFITHMFMHGGVMHILFNMYALWAFGSPLEAIWGRNKFLFFYFASGLGAGLVYTLVNYFHFHSLVDQFMAAGLSNTDIQHMLSSGNGDVGLQAGFSMEQLKDFYGTYHGSAVGASGAIYGILVAFAFKYPDVELMLIFVPIPIKAKYFIPGIVALDLFSGVTGFSIFGAFGGGNVAHFAHVGGALIGYLLMLYYKKTEFRRWN